MCGCPSSRPIDYSGAYEAIFSIEGTTAQPRHTIALTRVGRGYSVEITPADPAGIGALDFDSRRSSRAQVTAGGDHVLVVVTDGEEAVGSFANLRGSPAPPAPIARGTIDLRFSTNELLVPRLEAVTINLVSDDPNADDRTYRATLAGQVG